MNNSPHNGFETFFQEIAQEKPSDKIIDQIKALIKSGQLKPGDRLPPERKLVEKFGVGRGHVRDALKKLEFYGILKTLPQSGTVVAGLGVKALEGLINNVLQIESPDFYSLAETRILLEAQAARLAAERRTPQDIMRLSKTLEDYRAKVEAEDTGIEEDLMFHLNIAEASKNSVLRSLSMILFPDMVRYSREFNLCGDGRFRLALTEHETILRYIEDGDGESAASAMRDHLGDLLEWTSPDDS
ncbi:MAG: FadR/GntR family transcriptional regulator [Bacteroidota bacterium]